MAVVDIVSVLLSLVPFLNAGLIILIIDLSLRHYGFEISKKDFNRSPSTSLVIGLGLILISNLLYIIVQGLLSQILLDSSLIIFALLIITYYVIVVNMTSSTKHRRSHS